MMVLRGLLCLTLAFTVMTNAFADEVQKKKGKGKQATPSATARMLSGIELTDAQKPMVAAIDKEFAPKLQELAKKRNEILTPEQRTAQRDAQKKARASASTPAENRKAVNAALDLTPEQSEKMKELQKQQTELNGKVVVALKKVLTPEQQEKLPKVGANKKKGQAAKGKKKKNAN